MFRHQKDAHTNVVAPASNFQYFLRVDGRLRIFWRAILCDSLAGSTKSTEDEPPQCAHPNVKN